VFTGARDEFHLAATVQNLITTPCLPQSEIEPARQLFDNWFDPIEAGLRDRAREFLQTMLEAELDEGLARSRPRRRLDASSVMRS
jgi:hypothetical protein